MHTKILLPTLLITALTSAFVPLRRSVGDSCDGSGGATGVCTSTDDCACAGGLHVNNKCPNDPENVKCCTKTNCGPGNAGKCQFTWSSCSGGSYEANYCPGPSNFKCCVPDGSSGGPEPTPNLPSSSSGCKVVAINGAKKIIDAFPGKVKEIGCIRSCSDPSSSDDCTGIATDIMLAPGGVKTDAGLPIAEWAMDHCNDLGCKYVMWGRKIWERGVTAVKPCEDWPYQKCTVIPNCVHGDRGDNTQNHWDHVHVSYHS